jgi:hypothetical protein
MSEGLFRWPTPELHEDNRQDRQDQLPDRDRMAEARKLGQLGLTGVGVNPPRTSQERQRSVGRAALGGAGVSRPNNKSRNAGR